MLTSSHSRVFAASLASLACFATLLAACSGATPQAEVTEQGAQSARLCDAPSSTPYGVSRMGNKSGKPIETSGSEDLITNEMHATGCFTLIEREKIELLLEEIKRCSDDSPDKEYFDCESFAKKGELLGFKRAVFGDVVYFEPAAKGAAFKAKFPGVGGVELGRTYAAVALELRVVDVATGKVERSTVVHGAVPSDAAGVSGEAGGVALTALYSSKTPMAKALQTMIASAVADLREDSAGAAQGANAPEAAEAPKATAAP